PNALQGLLTTIAPEHTQFRGPYLHDGLRIPNGIGLGEYHMEVRTPETKGTYARLPVVLQPRRSLPMERKRAEPFLIKRVRCLQMQRWRFNAMVYRQGRLDYARQPSRAFRVANLRFDRSQYRTFRCSASSIPHIRQRAQFGAVAHHRTRPMCLDHPDSRGREPRLLVRTCERPSLSL